MFLKSYLELPVAFECLCAAMLAEPHDWLRDLATTAGRDGEQLLVEVGLDVGGHQVRRQATVDVGTAQVSDRTASLPLQLTVDGNGHLFPSFVGSLDAAWLGPQRTHLALSALYDPPFGLLGWTVDHALLHRVAEAVAHQFLESVADSLAARAGGPLASGRGRRPASLGSSG